jgi:hypothetical protein
MSQARAAVARVNGEQEIDWGAVRFIELRQTALNCAELRRAR